MITYSIRVIIKEAYKPANRKMRQVLYLMWLSMLLSILKRIDGNTHYHKWYPFIILRRITDRTLPLSQVIFWVWRPDGIKETKYILIQYPGNHWKYFPYIYIFFSNNLYRNLHQFYQLNWVPKIGLSQKRIILT